MKLLASMDGKVFYLKDFSSDFHCQYGVVSKDKLLSAADGDVVKTNTGKELFLISPGFIDMFRKIKRGPQIIPNKDIAAIISFTGLGKESVVVDSGSGSGATACFLANIVKQVYSYELRHDFFKLASENAKRLGLSNVTVKNQDVYLGIDEADVDLVVLDLPEPWKAIDAATNALKVGGFIVSYSPTIPQVADFVSAAGKKRGLVVLKTIEIIEREWEVSERKVRPKSAAIGHSGFMSFVRKITTK